MRTSARSLRAAGPVLLVVVLAVPLVWRLTVVPARQPVLAPLSIAQPQAQVRAVAVPYAGRAGDADEFRLLLTSPNVLALAAADEIHLTMATYATAAALRDGSLAIDGTPCRFQTTPGAVLVDNSLVIFRREPTCADAVAAATGTLQLVIRLQAQTGRIAVWTFEPPVSGRLRAVTADATLAVRGQTLTWPPPPTRTRLELLAYVWDVAPPVLWARLATTALMVMVGLALLLLTDPSRRRRGVAAAAVGTALVMSGLALGHAVLFPPLQTPDEPDFALSLANLRNDASLALDIEALARRTHFERLRHHSERQFREIDIGVPWPQRWDDAHIAAPPIAERSPVTAWWWRTIGVRGPARATEQLWRVRHANAILFGVSCGMAVAILAFALPAGRPAAFVLPMLAAPSLPFFASYLSETAVFVSVVVVLSACVAVLVIGTGRSVWIGVPLAAMLALVWLSGRTVWPLMIATASVLAGRSLTGVRPIPASAWKRVVFWAPLTVAVAGGAWLAQRAGVFGHLDQSLRVRSSSQSRGLAAAIALIPVMSAALLIALAAVEWLSERFRSAAAPPRWLGATVTMGAASWVVAGFLASAFVAFPAAGALPSVDAPFSVDFALRYATQVVVSLAVPFRLLHHDQLLSTFFWSGMGWVDLVAPIWLLDIVIAATVTMMVWSLRQAREEPARALRYGALLLGLAASLPVYAVGTYSVTSALYGRYLIGWYLLMVTTAWTAPALSARPWSPWLVGALAVHAYYLQSIPGRYF